LIEDEIMIKYILPSMRNVKLHGGAKIQGEVQVWTDEGAKMAN